MQRCQRTHETLNMIGFVFETTIPFILNRFKYIGFNGITVAMPFAKADSHLFLMVDSHVMGVCHVPIQRPEPTSGHGLAWRSGCLVRCSSSTAVSVVVGGIGVVRRAGRGWHVVQLQASEKECNHYSTIFTCV